MKVQLVLCFLAWISLAYCGKPQLYEWDECRLDSGERGVCIKQSGCPAVLRELSIHVRPQICSFLKNEPVVCCTQGSTTASTHSSATLPARHSAANTSIRSNTTTATSHTAITARPAKFGTTVTTTNARTVSTAAVGNTVTSPSRNGKSMVHPTIQGRLQNLTVVNAVAVVKQKCEAYAAYAVNPEDNLIEERPRVAESPFLSRNIGPGTNGPISGQSRDLGFRITGGEATEPGEFPHMAALGWGEKDEIVWLCGGSLISEKFILTAAHCLQSRGRGVVRWVRLGTDVANETTEHTQLLEVKAFHRHENYSMASYYNDIALLELEGDIEFNSYVRPACLHTEFVGSDHGAGTATGWGAINETVDASVVLMKVDIQFQRMDICNKTYAALMRTRRLNRGIPEESMICAGDLNDIRDTCQGDSGGPIQVPLSQPPNMHSIVGVTSFGVMGCGQSRAPAIYSRVSYYLPWIVNIVWPNM